MLLIMINVDLVHQNIRTVTLEKLVRVNFALHKLQTLQHLTDLTIMCTHEPIDLSAIAKCSSLKRLAIKNVNNVYNCLGTLERATLESLSVAFERRKGMVYYQFQKKLVALASTSTMKNLEVLNCVEVTRGAQELAALKLFSNLTRLKILPLCRNFCDMITEASCRLTTFTVMFDTYVGHYVNKYYDDMLGSPCLSQLEKLVIYFASAERRTPFDMYVSSCTSILDAVVSHQQSVI
jgi:hypothetical protein